MPSATTLTHAAVQAGLLIALTGCGSGMDISGDRDASKALRQAFQQHFANCSGTWTTVLPGGRHLQLAKPSFRVESDELTEAQKLNGITFYGRVHMGKHTSDRQYEASGYDRYHATWGKWHDSSLDWGRIQQRNGVWQFPDTNSFSFAGRSPDCAQVPPG